MKYQSAHANEPIPFKAREEWAQDVAAGKNAMCRSGDSVVMRDGLGQILDLRIVGVWDTGAWIDGPDAAHAQDDPDVRDVLDEMEDASATYPAFHSAHEGFAVLLEELDELKAEIWKSPTDRDPVAMRREAIQVAAMAIRFLRDCAPVEP